MSSLQHQAEALVRQGRAAEATLVFEQLLDQEPGNVQALGFLSMAALRDGQIPRSLQLAERAVAAAPQDALGHFQLGQVLDAQHDHGRSSAAYLEAVRRRPDFYLARLYLAHALQRVRDPLAALQFARALQDAQRAGRWLDAQNTRATLRPLIESGQQMLRDSRREAYSRLFEPLAREFGAAELARVRQCLAIYLQDAPAVYPDPRQRPTFLLFPGLPTAPYFDTATLAWVAALEARFAAIRDELLRLLPVAQQAERVFGDDAIEQQNLRGTRGAPSWNVFYFYRHGERRDDNSEACPATAGALDALPLCHVRGHGPEVLFSVFAPGTHLLPHRGVTNTRAVGHLPLIVPPDCALNVGGEIHEWREGRVVLFDDTYEHEAWNRSAELRVVLIFDVWNPHLSPAERAAVKLLVEAIGDFRHATDAL